MTSNLEASKIYFEQLFSDSWETTPIHFVGEEFDQDGTERWINPFFTPSYSQSKGLANLTGNYGVIRVACWAENDLQAMALTDAMIAFMSDNSTDAYRIQNYSIDDHGWHKTNKVYVIVSFNLEIFEGTC